MADNKRQHYIPRFLQRGFLDNTDETANRTWLHRRGAQAKLVGIRDIGVEDWFYSDPVDGQPTLDDEITKLESKLGTAVDHMRGIAPGAKLDAVTAARCVIHLVIRTNHIRWLVFKGVERLTLEMQSLFSDQSLLAKMLGVNDPDLSDWAVDAIRNVAIKHAPCGFPPSLAERRLAFLLREHWDEFARHASSHVAPLFPRILRDLASRIRDAHTQVLGSPLEESKWVSRLSTFHWVIQPGEDLILPDAIALAVEGDGHLVALLFATARDVKAVVMPISNGRILIGLSQGCDALDLTRFNAEAAAACSAFFIGARAFDAENLAERIGTAPATTIETAVRRAVRNMEHCGESRSPAATPPQARTFKEREFSYTVRLVDFGDAAIAKEVSDVVAVVVNEFARSLPLYDLDGITFALNYENALAELDLGETRQPRVKASALDYGIGVAIPVTVKRAGVRKEQIVFRAELAQSLVSSDVKARAIALNVLVKMLATVAHFTKFAKDAATAFRPDPLTAALHPAVAATPSSWFSARESAFVAPHLGGFYADLVMESIRSSEHKLAKERAEIGRSNDAGSVARQGLECVSDILERTADWLGHRAGLIDGQAFEGDDLPSRLQSRRLDKWLDLFGRDLAAVYEDGTRLNMSVVTMLSQHVERLLWAFGISVYLEGNTLRCFVTE